MNSILEDRTGRLDYFTVDSGDMDFYERYIRERLPDRVLDAHVHLNLPEHVAAVPKERIEGSWALRYGMVLPYEQAKRISAALFPGKKIRMLAFPWPLETADIAANNAYLSELAKAKKVDALMTVRPEWTAGYCEETLLSGGFLGFKPYPYMASVIDDAEVSIFDFMTRDQLSMLQRHKKALLIHLPRKGRLPDDNNIRELLDIRQTYPDIAIVLAHYGKCFTAEQLAQGLQKLGDDKDGFYFDNSGVPDAAVCRTALESIRWDRLLFGTDSPIFLWHGRMEWVRRYARLYCREDFSWNVHHEGLEAEKRYHHYNHELVKATLDALEAAGATRLDFENVFYNNAAAAYKIVE